MGFTIFCWTSKLKLCLLIWNYLQIVKILPVTLFRKLVLAFLKPHVTDKVVPKSRLWSWNLFRKPAIMYTGENRPTREKARGEKARGNKNLMRLIFRSSKWFQRSKQKPMFIFLVNKAGQKFKNHLLMYRKYWKWFNYIGRPSKKSLSGEWWPNLEERYDS